MDWSGRQRLQREQRELKAPQERSDEEIEAVPADASAWNGNPRFPSKKASMETTSRFHTRNDVLKRTFSVPSIYETCFLIFYKMMFFLMN